MQRKETFGTSGVRIKVRFFGGWDFKPDVLNDKGWVKTGYAKGVPMGGDLQAESRARSQPSSYGPSKTLTTAISTAFKLSRAGPRAARSSKRSMTWHGPAIASPIRLPAKSQPSATPLTSRTRLTRTRIGAVELKKVWRDPDFDPTLDAFYYVRVLQIPTPRWSTYDAKKLGVPPPNWVSATVQERAWTSPIWYSPDGRGSAQGRKARRYGCQSETEGGRATRRCPVNAVGRGKDADGSQYGYRPAVQDFLRPVRTASDPQRRREATAAG